MGCHNVIFQFISIVSSVAFILLNIADIFNVVTAIMVLIAVIQGIGMFLNVGFQMKEILALQIKFQDIVDDGNSFFD